MPRGESTNHNQSTSVGSIMGRRAIMLARALAGLALVIHCGCSGGRELAGMRDELEKVKREHASLAQRVEDLEAHKQLAETNGPHPEVAGATTPSTSDANKPLKIVKLEPKTASNESPMNAATSPNGSTGSIMGSTTGSTTISTTISTTTTSSDDEEPRPLLKIGPSGIEQKYPDGKKPVVSKNPVLDPQAAKDYDAAFALVKAKKPKQALEAFGAFIVRYPDHPYAANALYWRGECYFALAEFGSAVTQFEALSVRYPGSPKLPDALLKLGLAHRKLGSDSKARLTFDKLRAEFPTSDAAKKIPPEDAS